eukprot:1084918-Pleurochrysis_carterae.AAC.1
MWNSGLCETIGRVAISEHYASLIVALCCVGGATVAPLCSVPTACCYKARPRPTPSAVGRPSLLLSGYLILVLAVSSWPQVFMPPSAAYTFIPDDAFA